MNDGGEVCPYCGGEQPVAWMVTLVYTLAFLFVQGALYRLFWPNAVSMAKYGAWFAVTTLLAAPLWYLWKKFRLRRGSMKPVADHRDAGNQSTH
jgi:hypothetical protein